jgi:hypothetical protein
MHRSRSHDAVIRVYDAAGNVIEAHEHKGDFKEAERESPRRGFKNRKIKMQLKLPGKYLGIRDGRKGEKQQILQSLERASVPAEALCFSNRRFRPKNWTFVLKHPKIGSNSR